jgi:NTP pyrophosphatase (non-canonical NTP hydrolase)
VEGLRRDHRALLELGFEVLSPPSVDFTSQTEGFVFTRQEEGKTPRDIERGHLDAICRSDFLWLHAPDGYVGSSGSLEIGFAAAIGVPIFSRETPKDITIREFVERVDSPSAIPGILKERQPPTLGGVPAVFQPLRQMQSYYLAVAQRRGYARESIKDAMILITEEIGELARATRKAEGLPRHGEPITKALGPEVADVFLYLLHIANIVGIDLPQAVSDKEHLNERRVRKD